MRITHRRRRAESPEATAVPGRVVVIGAGLAGLTAGLYLRGAGHDVTIIERAAVPGGLVRTETLRAPDGTEHRFDTGATILTMPGLIVDALGAVGVGAADARSRLNAVTVDPGYWMRFADGTQLRVRSERDAFLSEVGATFGARQAAGVDSLLDWLARLHAVEFDSFIDRNFDGLTDFARRDLRSDVGRLVSLGTTRGLTGAIARHVDDERLQRAFTFQALYAGVPPARAAAIYAIIAHMDIGLGVSYPLGGMGRVGAVLADAFEAAGGRIHYRTRATALRGATSRISTITATDHAGVDHVYTADSVVAAVGVPVIESLLAAGELGGSTRRRIRYSPSAVVIHGTVPTSTTRDWPGDHHTIDFGAAWRQTFAQIAPARGRRGRLMSDPSLLITRPAVTDPETFCAAGAESVSVLAPCPNLHAAPLDWSALAPSYTAEILQTLRDRGYRGIDAMAVLRVDRPDTWAAAGHGAGTPFSAAHTVRQTGPLRTPNRWPGIDNLFVAGAATVPGVGIPPVLVSGRLAAARVDTASPRAGRTR